MYSKYHMSKHLGWSAKIHNACNTTANLTVILTSYILQIPDSAMNQNCIGTMKKAKCRFQRLKFVQESLDELFLLQWFFSVPSASGQGWVLWSFSMTANHFHTYKKVLYSKMTIFFNTTLMLKTCFSAIYSKVMSDVRDESSCVSHFKHCHSDD